MIINKNNGNFTPTFKYQDSIINTDKNIKYLGVIIDDKLNFAENIKARLDSGRRALVMLSRICGRTWGMNPEHLIHLYKTVIVPIVTYGCEIWAHPSFVVNYSEPPVLILQ